MRMRTLRCGPVESIAAAAFALSAAGANCLAQSEVTANPVILQWFELSWNRMERRIPDFFMAGYGATWVAPISKASDPTSPGFDVFDRFDLGSPNTAANPNAETIYGTEQGFRATVDMFHRANGQVFVDSVMNHNSGRNGGAQFIADGGYPQFWMNPPGPKTTGSGDWGDFFNGFFQSHDPGGGAGPYNLWEGDLVGLIDINQNTNHQFIRHPVEEGNPQNLPAGNLRNRPDPLNARFYPDQALSPMIVNNPGRFRAACCGYGSFNTPAEMSTVYPFNTVNPFAGDAITENATGVLTRWTQWMLDEFKVDGFRLDAAKHIYPWFWDRYFDVVMHNRRIAPDGSRVNPISFGENVEGPQFVWNYYVRKDSFAQRDALDLSNAGDIRNIIGAKGAGNIASINNNTIDVMDDGFNNGSVGVRHIHSHDNGSRGDGATKPDYPFEDKIGFWAYAYMLMRPGHNIVYLNAREMHDRFPAARGGFWPREGVPTALGLGGIYKFTPWTVSNCASPTGPSANSLVIAADDRITRLVQLSQRYGRGWFVPRVSGDGSVYIYERQTPGGVGNVLVCVNDEYNACVSNFDSRTFNTAFPAGMVLVELTGNATDATVDPSNSIFDTITVGAGGSVTVRVPRNTTRNGTTHTEHNRGYVIYGPATPQGTLEIVGASATLPPDSPSIAVYARRLTPVDVVQGPTFEIKLTTNRAGYPGGDTNFDDKAIFRIDQGFRDYNGNGSFDETSGEFRGYEHFLTQNQPIFGTANANGFYRQIINTDLLEEGYHYISVPAFRQRATGAEAGGLPLCNDFRRVIYVDRQEPDLALLSSSVNCANNRATIRLYNGDRTATRLHVFVNQPVGTPTLGNQATPVDRQEWTYLTPPIPEGMNTVNVLVIEEPSAGVIVRQAAVSFQISNDGVLRGDVNRDGLVDFEDLIAFYELTGFQCEADVNASGVIDAADARLLQQAVREDEVADITQFNP